jgi:predicted Rossmann fold flavoprotein
VLFRSAARRGRSVVIFERMPRLGKKILVTGGGRCNIANEVLEPAAYNSTSADLVAAVLARFGSPSIRLFFKGLGLETIAESDGRVFPATNQAASVLRVLERELAARGVVVELSFDVVRLGFEREGFLIEAGDGRKMRSRTVILAGGGKSYPALGSNGSIYALAEAFGHRLVPPAPSAVPLLVKDRLCHLLQGQKIRARATALVDGTARETAEGDALFAAYGLSGTAILDASESLSLALHRETGRRTEIALDMVPFLGPGALAAEFAARLRSGWAVADLVSGILPEKFRIMIGDVLPAESPDPEAGAAVLAFALKNKRFAVQGTRGWNEAEFTSGGIDAREVDPGTMQSRCRNGLYLTGEMLDVQGKRGGYNLAWAWASGHVAGDSV